MAGRKVWSPDRRDMIWINCNPQAGREMKDIISAFAEDIQ
jgi:mRNA interferase MazF